MRADEADTGGERFVTTNFFFKTSHLARIAANACCMLGAGYVHGYEQAFVLRAGNEVTCRLRAGHEVTCRSRGWVQVTCRSRGYMCFVLSSFK